MSTVAFVRTVSPEAGATLALVRADGGRVRTVPSPASDPAGPAWSPDGRRIALDAGTGADRELFVMDVDGSPVCRLTTNDVPDLGAAWSPDGRRIAFVRSAGERNRRSSIWIVGADGRNARRLTGGPADLQPSFTADGDRVVFLRTDPRTGAARVHVVPARGGRPRAILRSLGTVTQPIPAPTGGRLLAVAQDRILTTDLTGGATRRLVTLTRDAGGALQDPAPAWAPDGRAIVFSQLRRGTLNRSDLWIVRSDGRGLRRLTRSDGFDTAPTWGQALNFSG